MLALVVLNDVTLGGQRTYGDDVGVWMQQRAEGQGRLSAWSQLPLN